ncbi:asparagine synthase (glutamine-hydrolyzing) [Halalkalibacillus halophilus]|uniref:asparagine synthase (glutamine-hydrolyzing) n=1 Tax=Halalkalibacillus halophilus TaxID=392827 RepID=UPI0003F53EED|nr:asparagine synthase (glutamine-hydrolyzing) [Halalkalibacillus halophilus]
MCGIAGWINYENVQASELTQLKEMTDSLYRRGMDGEGFYMNKDIAFGHRRLAIIDVENGAQPMTVEYQEAKFTIIYNGELYHMQEVRNYLIEQGHAFQTTCDTEVVVHAYAHWGADCLDHLNGIFAFAIWDEEKREVFLARDRLGVKPLFYAEKSNAFYFASEIKALLKVPTIRPIVDQEGLSEIFGLGPSRTPGHAVFKQIQELEAGHAMLIKPSSVEKWRYWQVKSEPHHDSLEETIEKVRELFINAVEGQLVSDVPVGTFLSGGLDSSAITAVAANYLQDREQTTLKTFSIDYQGNEEYFQTSTFQPNNDRDFKALISEKYETKHKDFFIDEQTLATYLQESVHVRDVPGMADIDSSLLWFCEQVKDEVSVGLSGECADEIFGGYPWFQAEESYSNFPWIRSLERRNALLRPEWRKKLQLDKYIQKRFQDTIADTPLLEGESEQDERRRQLFYVNMQWFMAQLLERKDRMSMGATLEVRVPFADHYLVEYLWNVPWEMKQLDGEEKGLLRKSMEGLLPDEIVHRKKSPYPKTFQPLYEKLVRVKAEKMLVDPEARIFEIVSKEAFRNLMDHESTFETPWYGQLMAGPQLLAHLWQIDYWMRAYHIEVEG